MIACPECGANLRFDITLQKMKCEYCGESYSPDDKLFNTQSETSSDDMMDVMVFTCPSCGAEMYSEDTSATAFCSYCGASNVLEQRLEGVKRPVCIVPFAKTEEECRDLIKKEIKGFPFAPKAFKKGLILDRLRPVYIPYWDIEAEDDGQVTGTGVKEYSQSDNNIKETYDISLTSKSRYSEMLFDASAALDDTLAAEIAPFSTEGRKEFKPAYLSGFYAETANVDSSVYEENAGQIADSRLDEELKKSLDMEVKVDKRPEHKYTARSMMFPVWFASMRQGKRVCYALVNGYTGKVHCDTPIDIFKYLLATFVLSLPIFAVLNALFTLKPMVSLFIAAFVGCLISIAAANVTDCVRKRNEHTNDKGYRSMIGALPTKEDYARDAADTRTAEQIDAEEKKVADKEEEKKKKSKAAIEKKYADEKKMQEKEESKVSKVLEILSFPFVLILAVIFESLKFLLLGFAMLFVLIVGFLIFDNLQIVLYAVGIIGLLISFLLNSYHLDMSGHEAASSEFGETGVSKKGGEYKFHFPGIAPIIINVAIIIGGVIVQRDYVDDVYYYFATTLILAASLIGIVLVVWQYNKLSTRPLPFLKTTNDGKSGKSNGSKGGKLFAILFLAAVLSAAVLPLGTAMEVGAETAAAAADYYRQTARGYEYTNPETSYKALVCDEADLLSDEEERMLADQIEELTAYGNIAFISGNDPSMTDHDEYCENVYRDAFGCESGTVFLIDMTSRKVGIFSDGANYKIITSNYANSITDNVYQYASDGEYYSCASEAFLEIGKLLDGQRISQPMKYINNFLISLVLSGMIVWIVILCLTASKARSKQEVTADIKAVINFTDPRKTLIDIKSRSESSDFSGGGSSGSGGGSSGGGGSHGF